MKTLAEAFKNLPGYKEFDPKAFIEDEIVSKEVCGFVLSLALVYNDLKNTYIWDELLLDNAPGEDFVRSSEWGEYSGLQWHNRRVQMSIMSELFSLIKKNQKTLQDDWFKKFLKNLPKESRESWEEVVLVSRDHDKNSMKPLHRVRNKILYHYDSQELLKTYRKAFITNNLDNQNPCISLGKKTMNIRFFLQI